MCLAADGTSEVEASKQGIVIDRDRYSWQGQVPAVLDIPAAPDKIFGPVSSAQELAEADRAGPSVEVAHLRR